MLESILPAAVGGIFKLAGGLFGRSSAKKDRKEMLALQEAYRMTPQKIRDEALAAGFNPLTVLGANAGGQFNSMAVVPPLSSQGVLSEIASTLGNVISSYDPVADETKKLENELLRKQIEQVDAQDGVSQRTGLGGVPQVRVVETGTIKRNRPATLGDRQTNLAETFEGLSPENQNRMKGAVLGRPIDKPDFPVRDPQGNIFLIPTSYAQRLKLDAFKRVMGEDYEAMLSDLGGNVVFITKLPGMITSGSGGNWSDDWPTDGGVSRPEYRGLSPRKPSRKRTAGTPSLEWRITKERARIRKERKKQPAHK